MAIIRHFGMVLLLMMAATKSLAQDQKQIFIYCPNEKAGLHIAQQTEAGWQEIGQLCSSDYGTWGAEKRMYHPSVARAADGSWRLVFQVNDKSPMLAVAYSKDLIKWRPQDYPIMSTRQCLSPVVFPNDNGTFDIYYKTKGGDKRWVSASADFRRFSKDEASQIGDAAWIRNTITIDGKEVDGSLFDITSTELQAITSHFDRQAKDRKVCQERMHNDKKDNPVNTPKPITATLKVSAQEKPISDKLIGIFFEDISYAADGGLYAELIQNRDFEYIPKDHRGWSATTSWSGSKPVVVISVDPLSENNPHYAVLGNDTIYNEGWDGIAVTAGAKYDFSMFVRNIPAPQGKSKLKKDFVISLITEDGSVIAQAKVKTQGADWRKYEAVLTATQTCEKARLAVAGLKDEKAGIDIVSLFPRETFMGPGTGDCRPEA